MEPTRSDRLMHVAAVTLFALLLVAGGMWLARAQKAAPSEASEDEGPDVPELVAPEGYRLLPYLSEERSTAFTAAEEVLEPGLDYAAVLETSAGRMVIELHEEQAPRTVNNFVFLTLNRFYDGVPFHRVLDDFMAQTGDPTGTGRGGPGYTFADEAAEGLTHDSRGVVSMANAGPDTNGSQFFITFAATPWLDGRHTVFGRVIEGDEVLDRLKRVDPQQPQAVIRIDGTLADLADQGVTLEGPPELTLREHLEAKLGAVPAVGQTFALEGLRGVVGRAGGVPAVGFFPEPDVIERAAIVVRSAEQ